MDTMPPSQPDNSTPSCSCNKGIIIAVIACSVLALILPLLSVNYGVSVALILISVILSIVAIVKKSKAFGIIMLIVNIVVVGPGSMGIFVMTSSKIQQGLSLSIDSTQKITKLTEQMQKAQAAGNKEEAQRLEKEIQNVAKEYEASLKKLTKD